MSSKTEQDWESSTWSGSHRAMIRQSLKLTILEHLEALDELCKTSEK